MSARLPRRQVLAAASAVLWGSVSAPAVRAGAQREEPLSDSVRTALSAAVADEGPPQPVFEHRNEQRRYEAWLVSAGERIRRVKTSLQTRQEFLQTLWYESQRAALEPALVLGLIEVESGFRKYAISTAGARGYMQVMPFWMRLIGDGDESRLFHLQTNLRFGCTILRHYLQIERGELVMALGRYNGSRGQLEYPRAVLGAQRRWQV